MNCSGNGNALDVNTTNGLIYVGYGIQYDGGTTGTGGFNVLQLAQTRATVRTSDNYTVGPNPGQGADVIVDAAGDVQIVNFQNMALEQPVPDIA